MKISYGVNEKFTISFLFFLATLVAGITSLAAFCFVWVKQRVEMSNSIQGVGFLANEQKTLNFYKIFSAAYDTLNPFLYPDQMRRRIVSQIKDGTHLRVLDVGCGTGYTTFGLLKRTDICEVIGLDMNSAQLKRAAKNLSLEKDRLSISRGDADNLPFADESFDALVSIGAIEYFPEPQQALIEFTRVTKPGGTVVVAGPEAGWFKKFGLNKFFYTPSVSEMNGFFREAGLLGVELLLTGVNTFFGTERYVVAAIGNKPSSGNFHS